METAILDFVNVVCETYNIINISVGKGGKIYLDCNKTRCKLSV